MKVPYSYFPSSQPGFNKIYLPYLKIKLINGFKEFKTTAMVDSGAQITIVNKTIAEKILGVNLNESIKSNVIGITGSKVDLFLTKIELEVFELANSRRKIDIGIIDKANFGILLGEIGFMEFFNVAFCFSKKYFYVNPS